MWGREVGTLDERVDPLARHIEHRAQSTDAHIFAHRGHVEARSEVLRRVTCSWVISQSGSAVPLAADATSSAAASVAVMAFGLSTVR